ncbi:MAG TPA: pitrilysin family protein, partial [Candidatus Ozemobacteraceae bacterium]
MNQERTSSGFRWEPFQHRVLPNGLTVLVREHRTAPLFVSDIWVRVGSRNELPETGGIAHFLEHTLFKGTPTRGVGAIAREIEGFGGRTNAGTSLDYTHYYISGESRNLDQALEIHADVMRRSTLEVTAVDAERSVIVEEIKRSADNPHRVLWDTMMAGLYPGHPYGRPTLGPKENISTNISRDTLNTFFRTWYVPGNMFLLVVGDVDAEAVFRHVEELYGDWTAPTPACRAISLPPRPEAGTLVRRAMDVRRGYLQAAWRTVSQANREDATGLELLGILLGQGRSSRLSASLKERRGIVTSISAGQLSLGEDGIFLVRAEFDPLDEAPVREGIRVEIDRLRREPVSGEELLKAMDMLETLYMRGAETNEGQADILGNALIHDALEHELTYLQRLRAITPERLQRLAVQYLAEEADFTTLAGPRPRSTPLVASAAGSAPNAGVTAWRLDNGMRVIHRYLGGIGLAG